MNTCGDCICRYCLYWWSSRCPYGQCFDDLRAKENPFDEKYPHRSPRKLWSDWAKDGEQAHWCRGGIVYPTDHCEYFEQYTGQRIVRCVEAQTQEFQDGYVICLIRENMSCTTCMENLSRKLK